jgi:two-component system, NtrC family, sensor kinase
MAAFSREQRSRLAQSERLASVGSVTTGIAQDLRRPLEAILEALPPDHRDLEHLATRCAIIETEVLRCMKLVDGMVLLSLPEHFLDLRPVDLRRLCDEVSDGVRLLAGQAKVRLTVQGGGCALADRWKLRHALFNVMKNAVEAAGWEGEVHVEVVETEDGPQVRVSDTGPGLVPGIETALFRPLFSTKESGSGLGLAVSRAILRAHGGDIDAWNGDQGGAVFTLQFPSVPERAEQH